MPGLPFASTKPQAEVRHSTPAHAALVVSTASTCASLAGSLLARPLEPKHVAVARLPGRPAVVPHGSTTVAWRLGRLSPAVRPEGFCGRRDRETEGAAVRPSAQLRKWQVAKELMKRTPPKLAKAPRVLTFVAVLLHRQQRFVYII